MAVMLMGKEKNPDATPAEPEVEKVTSLRVRPPARDMVGKVATLRGVSVADLFEQNDVQTFFTHLLMAEMKKEMDRIQPGQSPPKGKK